MDRRLMIKELAELVGVSPDTIINWELRGVKPTDRNLEKTRALLREWGYHVLL
ncbi:MAG: MerR family DNA-binding transcriptional regulator [Candidatus Omnitrophica bacterium]|nr:MerR family DNA-binding transcriptional regulator [Candidatus Omnitrophota bacterium]